MADSGGDFLLGFLPLFYLKSSSNSSFKEVSEVPDYVQQVKFSNIQTWLRQVSRPTSHLSTGGLQERLATLLIRYDRLTGILLSYRSAFERAGLFRHPVCSLFSKFDDNEFKKKRSKKLILLNSPPPGECFTGLQEASRSVDDRSTLLF